MSLALGTPTVTDYWYDGKRLHVIGTIAVGASPLTYAPGGVVMTFAGLVQSSLPPKTVFIHGISGFYYEWAVGTTIANGKMIIRVENTVGTNTPLAEHSTAAIVSGVSGDTISFYAIFSIR